MNEIMRERKMKLGCQGWMTRRNVQLLMDDEVKVNWFRSEREMMNSALDFLKI